MSKPLARYADDDDLDKTLKQKEISGLDPMLEYINRKKRKKEAKEGKGNFLPNIYQVSFFFSFNFINVSNPLLKNFQAHFVFTVHHTLCPFFRSLIAKKNQKTSAEKNNRNSNYKIDWVKDLLKRMEKKTAKREMLFFSINEIRIY